MKTKITPPQNRMLHALLSEAGLMGQKKELIGRVTRGRATSARELTGKEAAALISHLETVSAIVKMRRKVFSLCYECDLLEPGNPENAPFIDNFLLKHGTVKKPLSELGPMELTKVIRQFAALSKRITEVNAEGAVGELLAELGIRVAQEESDSS